MKRRYVGNYTPDFDSIRKVGVHNARYGILMEISIGRSRTLRCFPVSTFCNMFSGCFGHVDVTASPYAAAAATYDISSHHVNVFSMELLYGEDAVMGWCFI